MRQPFLLSLALVAATAAVAVAQTPSTTTRTRRQSTTTTTKTTPAPSATTATQSSTTTAAVAPGGTSVTTTTKTTRTRRANPVATNATREASDPAARAVRATFETLLSGIRKADADAVMSVYWNSPQLLIFNNNGTVTRGWEQVKANRVSLYADVRNVEIDARDVRVQMLGRDGAIVSCLWTQSQEFRGTPESAAGRLTVIFRLINNGWKIVHTHTSPEAPDPSRLLPSEQTAPTRVPAATPATKPPATVKP